MTWTRFSARTIHTWADYLANEAKLAANHTAAGARPAREGVALCQGIIICGSCGKPMMTNYHTDQRPSYECSSRRDRLTTPSCRTVVACVDDAVAAALLNALTPERVALALAAADQVTDGRQRISRAAELAVECARYEADRAERAFHESNRRTGWSPVPSRRGGRPSSPRSPRPSRPRPQLRRRCRRSLAGPSWPNSPPTCPDSGTPPPPAPRTEKGCCAP
jgi:hypothetical protein